MAKRKRLNLGNSDFKNLIEDDSYFVDKSLFIEEVIESEQSVLLFPRPRRFGKTLNLSMLHYFFDKNEPNNERLFTDLLIWKTNNDIKQHCGRYPVIFISFKDAKANSWEGTLSHLKLDITKVYKEHAYLLENDLLLNYEKESFTKILKREADDFDYEISIKQLSEYLYRYHQEKVVILIDEYDTPIQAGYGKFYDEVVSFMRNLLSGALKDNSYLYKGIITGILRVSKESIFSGLNNLSVFSVLDDEFSNRFGFTESETLQIISDFEIKTPYKEIKKWYDGYKFGETSDIYNPWSILNFVISKNETFKMYWLNSSTNKLIKDQINKRSADSIRQDILKLINNEPIVKDIEANFVFSDLDEDKELLWTLLVYSGYLTSKRLVSRKKYELFVPNYEIKTIFQDTIMGWLRKDVKLVQTLVEDTASYLVNNQLAKFEAGFQSIMGDTFSYYDTAKNHEYVYQAYILGLLAIIGDDYVIRSNREGGKGRYDIMLIPHDKTQNGVVIEIKQLDKQADRTQINTMLQQALAQIDQNEYYNELLDHQIPVENIVKVPIVFAGKEPYVCIQ